MARISRRFHVPTDPAVALEGAGWSVDRTNGALHATQGSQLRTRLFGGWFVKPAVLPKRLEALPAADGEGYDVTVAEALGVGYVDRLFRRRYDAAFDDLERRIGS